MSVRLSMRLVAVAALIGSAGAFQNCAGSNFSAGSSPGGKTTGSEDGTGSIPAAGQPFVNFLGGLTGGHFDLDTSSQVYADGMGQTDHHVHAYDDRFNLSYADFFNLADNKLKNIQTLVPLGTRFVLLIANAQLSPKGVLSINGQEQSVVDYQNKVAQFIAGNTAALPVFTLNGATDTKLTGLKIGFSLDSILNGGLIGTETKCVVANDFGKLGEYRNGSLTIQAIDVAALKINASTKTADLNGGLLWEATLFYHHDKGCYQ